MPDASSEPATATAKAQRCQCAVQNCIEPRRFAELHGKERGMELSGQHSLRRNLRKNANVITAAVDVLHHKGNSLGITCTYKSVDLSRCKHICAMGPVTATGCMAVHVWCEEAALLCLQGQQKDASHNRQYETPSDHNTTAACKLEPLSYASEEHLFRSWACSFVQVHLSACLLTARARNGLQTGLWGGMHHEVLAGPSAAHCGRCVALQ